MGLMGYSSKFVGKSSERISTSFVWIFFDGKVGLKALNDSSITLIPKKLDPETTSDFQPISLLNSCIKLITKNLANRLQKWILQPIHTNKYGFLLGLLNTSISVSRRVEKLSF